MEHTPGEWIVTDGFQMDELYFIYVMSGETHIARVDNENKEICEANAHLIAKSPKMYKALKEIDRWFVDNPDVSDDPQLHIIQIHMQQSLQ